MEGLDVLEGPDVDIVLNSASNTVGNDVKCNVEGLGWWIGRIMEDFLSFLGQRMVLASTEIRR